MITVDVRRLAEVQAALNRLASDQMPYALSVALNTTVFAVQEKSRAQLESVFDKPTPLIKGATRVEKSTKETLTARVYIDPKRAGVLKTHEAGGERGNQVIEKLAQGKGWLSATDKAVPTDHMPLNAYGNPKRAEVNKLIAVLQSGMSGSRTKTKRVFVIPMRSHRRLPPGIYQVSGSQLLMIYRFVARALYKPVLKWEETVAAAAMQALPDAARRAVHRAIETAR